MFELDYQCDTEDQAQALEHTALAFTSWVNYLSYQSLGICKMDILILAL